MRADEPPRGPPPGWGRLLWSYGFPMLFAVVCLGYGLWFGTELIKTQRAGIGAIQRIEVYEQEQTYQMRQMEEHLYRLEALVRKPEEP